MLFYFSFSSLYKNQFVIHPHLLRYLQKNLLSESDHFYIQIQEQKRKKLYQSGAIPNPYRVVLTNKIISSIIEKCETENYEQIVVEVNSGTREEIILVQKLISTGIPVNAYINSFNDNESNDCFHKLNLNSILHFTDLFKPNVI